MTEASDSPAWRRVARTSVAVSRLLGWRVHISGVEHIPASGPGVMVFNHHSAFDAVSVAWAPVLERGRAVRFLAKKELFDVKALGGMIGALGCIPVERGSARSRGDAFDSCLDALGEGSLIAVAPEQTRSRSLEILPFRQGAAKMSARAGCPILPAVTWGSQRLFSRHGKLPRIARVDILVEHLPAVHVTPEDDPAEIMSDLRSGMISALMRLQDRYPGGHPVGAPWVPARLGGSAPSAAEGLRTHRSLTAAWASSGGRFG